MARLSYKTRYGSTYQNKSRVYFACHPADFDKYFDSICKEIWDTQDCVIFYNSDYKKHWDKAELAEEFAGISLVVVPITSRFLIEHNEAREVEFEYAKNNGIPLLPLMQERGLEKAFNQICGNLQFLDKRANSLDLTAIPYEEKLKRFLSGVLLGDEQIENIKREFDAFVFLSYRKIDRQYAQSLMRLIHENELFRDIGFWYDEFLIPGEHFDEAILSNIQNCDLFSLVVTDNIIKLNAEGQENYIVTEEYPNARKAGKVIFPVDMGITDVSALHRKLDHVPEQNDYFPDPVNSKDIYTLSQALKDNLKKIAVAENDSEPAHLFFVGLAYLNGIYVEANRERGASLIKSAAEQNLPEAMEKLAQMYQSGEGVERNYEMAAQWSEKLAEYWEKRYDETREEDDRVRAFEAIFDAGRLRQTLFQDDTALINYKKAERIINNDIGRDNRTERYKGLILCYGMFSMIYSEKHQPKEAIEWSEKACSLYEQLSQIGHSENDYNLQLLGATCYSGAARVCFYHGDMSNAMILIDRSIEMYEQVYSRNKTLELCDLLISMYCCKSQIYHTQNKPKSAESWCKKAEELYSSMEECVELSDEISDCYSVLGDSCRKNGEMSKAINYYQKAIALRENSTDCRPMLNSIVALDNVSLGDCYKKIGNTKEAEVHYLRAVKLCNRFYEETKFEDAIDHLRVCCEHYLCLFMDNIQNFSPSSYYAATYRKAYKKIESSINIVIEKCRDEKEIEGLKTCRLMYQLINGNTKIRVRKSKK